MEGRISAIEGTQASLNVGKCLASVAHGCLHRIRVTYVCGHHDNPVKRAPKRSGPTRCKALAVDVADWSGIVCLFLSLADIPTSLLYNGPDPFRMC